MRRPYDRALVLGLGRSGEAAARLLLGEGTQVIAVDSNDSDELRRTGRSLQELGGSAMLACESLPCEEFSVCVTSPGVPDDSRWIEAVAARDCPVISEMELGWSRCDARTVAITGSNGKSTLAKLCYDSLADAGHRVELAGNYGRPISEIACETDDTAWVVLEVSSFQLERVAEFRPDIGVLLNIFPNHLDRHGDMKTYERTKYRLFERMRDGDTAIVPAEAKDLRARLSSGQVESVTFGSSGDADYSYAAGVVRAGGKAGGEEVRIKGTMFDNEILGLTAAAAVAVAHACGLEGSCVAAASENFDCLPHRMQKIAEKRGVAFVDDSKATNVAAMCAALRMSSGPVRLIAGGRLKENDLSPAKELLEKRVSRVYLIGEAADAMAASWGDSVACEECEVLEKAVNSAWREAGEGDTILLSPGCASFDQFTSFEERGERFQSVVKSLTGSN